MNVNKCSPLEIPRFWDDIYNLTNELFGDATSFSDSAVIYGLD